MLSAENSIIGTLCLFPEAYETISARLTPADFGSSIAAAAYEAAISLYISAKPIDILLIRDNLVKNGYNKDEADRYLVSCMEMCATSANTEEYCRIIKEDAQSRKLLHIVDSVSEGLQLGQQWTELAAKAIEDINELGDASGGTTSSKDSLISWAKYYNTIKNDPEQAFVRTGYTALDNLLGGGFINSGLYLIAARPGMGKTTVAINIADNIAKRRPVLFVSLEMSSVQITAKRISIYSGLPYNKLMTGRLSDTEYSEAISTASNLSERSFYLSDNVQPVADIYTLARSIKDLACVMVDYVGIIPPAEHHLSIREDIIQVSADLKRMAKRLNVPVIAMCQINRENTMQKDKRPTISNLRDSGSLEQDADGVILLHRESYYSEEKQSTEPLEMILGKNRHGNTGTVKFMWQAETGQVLELNEKDLPF